MYEYRFYNTISTKPSSIYDENGKEIGTITKKYSNPIQKILDILLKGRYFVNYELENAGSNVVFRSKKELNPFKKRQYYIKYYKNNEEYSIHIVDKRSFSAAQITNFEYNKEIYELEKSINDWAVIKKSGAIVGEWNSTIKPPFKANFKLVDKDYEDELLLLIGIFHTYLHAV